MLFTFVLLAVRAYRVLKDLKMGSQAKEVAEIVAQLYLSRILSPSQIARCLSLELSFFFFFLSFFLGFLLCLFAFFTFDFVLLLLLLLCLSLSLLAAATDELARRS